MDVTPAWMEALASITSAIVAICAVILSVRTKQLRDTIKLALNDLEKIIDAKLDKSYYNRDVLNLKFGNLELRFAAYEKTVQDLDKRVAKTSDYIGMVLNSMIGNKGIMPFKDKEET